MLDAEYAIRVKRKRILFYPAHTIESCEIAYV